jgi:hypothetical protein
MNKNIEVFIQFYIHLTDDEEVMKMILRASEVTPSLALYIEGIGYT